jgi:hypothetical protein
MTMLNLIADILTGRLKAQARQRAIVVALAGLATLMIVIALAHALSALRTWLSARYDPIVADLIVGGGFLVVALVFAIAANIVASRKPAVDPNAALTGALAPMALAMVVEWMKPRGDKPAAAPEQAPRAADVNGAEPPADHKAGGALLALLPLVAVGLLLGRKLRG